MLNSVSLILFIKISSKKTQRKITYHEFYFTLDKKEI